MNRKFIAKKEGKEQGTEVCACACHLCDNTRKNAQVCKQVVTNMFTNCRQVVFALFVPVVVTSLEQAVNNNV
jgi:hypothetical protein